MARGHLRSEPRVGTGREGTETQSWEVTRAVALSNIIPGLVIGAEGVTKNQVFSKVTREQICTRCA